MGAIYLPMRALSLFLFVLVPAVAVAAPVNDHVAGALALNGTEIATTGSNVLATVEPGENTRDGVAGATVWYSWSSPAVAGWVRMNTFGSEIDTVLQVYSGSAMGSLVSVGWNDEAPDEPGMSTVSFFAAANTAYRISVGGYAFGEMAEGNFSLNIVTGAAARPAYWPATVALNPAAVDVSTAPAPVSVGLVVQSVYSVGAGKAVLGADWTAEVQSRTFGQPAAWDLSLPQSGSPSFNFSVPRFFPPGAHALGLRIVSEEGDEYVFGGPDSGLPYVMPPPPGSARVLNVTNTGLVDEDGPALVSLTMPAVVDVTAGAGSVTVAARVTDATAGVAWVRVQLLHPGGVRPLSLALGRTAGSALDGTWSGSLAVPHFYPTENYGILVETADAAGNVSAYGAGTDTEIPGGVETVGITGGGAYELWAWSQWFEPYDGNAGAGADADGDGRTNLVSYAFGLNPLDFPASTGSLPVVTLTGAGSDRRLRIVWQQRKAATESGLTYTSQFTSSLSSLWQDGGRSRAVRSIDEVWEEITVEDSVATGGSARRFARVKVEYAP
jgi:hypothetical protein